MSDSKDREMFVMPVCYHPTTVLSVDDDVDFSKILQLSIDNLFPLLAFNNPKEVREYIKKEHQHFPFASRCVADNQFNLSAMRNELYNKDRFKEIFINVTDYDMPHVSGIELIKSMEFSKEISQYGHIILTGKISDEFKKQIEEIHLADGYIGKDDPDYVSKLISLVDKRSNKIFQLYSYPSARILSKNPEEHAFMLFDGNFIEIFNQYVKEHEVCEFYLFDKQGSYVFLDQDANLSWLFIRNEKGLENSIHRAQKYGAPLSVIDALKSRKYILSLYEEDDFKRIQPEHWEHYLRPATLFETDDKYLGFFSDLLPEGEKSQYYYSFTDVFPDNGIDKERILSYRQYIESQI